LLAAANVCLAVALLVLRPDSWRRGEAFELVFAGAVVVFAARGGPVRPGLANTLAALTGLVAVAAAAAWVVFALEPTRALAVAAGGLTVCAGLELGTLALQRLVVRAQDVERQLDQAETRLDALVARETEAHVAEIERTLARARADSLSRLVAEERRIGEERRSALVERENKASAELARRLRRSSSGSAVA
jgi:hypothetical protein